MRSRWLWGALAVALVLRLGMLAATPDYRTATDAADYDRVALALSETGSFPQTLAPGGGPTAYRAPLYPMMLAATYEVAEVTGGRWTVARILQALLGTLSCLLLALLAGRLWDRRVAVAAAWLAAVHVPFLAVGATLFSENLLVPLVLGALLAATQSAAGGGTRWAIAAGVLGGAAALTHANALVVLVPAALLAARGLPRGRPWLGRASVVALAGVLAVVPWTVRNLTELDTLVPISTAAGPTIAGTYNATTAAQQTLPANWTEYWRDPVVAREIAAEGGGEVALDAATRRAGLRYLREHPGYVAKAGWWNSRRMLGLNGDAWLRFEAGGMGLPLSVERASYIGLWLMLALALAGLVLPLVRRGPWELWLAPLLLLLTVVFLVGYQRVRLPADPFIVLLAALGVVGLLERRVRTPTQEPAAVP